MRASILLALVIFTYSFATQAQEIQFQNYTLGEFEEAEKLSPDMSQGSSGLVCDYFVVENGANGSRYFKFTNVGDAPLEIFEAVSDCKCITTTCPKGAIAPGESDYIVVTYDTKLTGDFMKYIKIESNSNQPNVYLKVSGFVSSPKDKSKPVSKNGLNTAG
jgi:hypothetical protein